MTDIDTRFHETWLGMVQPVEGLVVSVPVLVDAQCMERQPPEVQRRLVALCPPTETTETGPACYTIRDLHEFLRELLGLTPDLYDTGDAIPDDLSLYVPEGRQTLRPTLALRKLAAPASAADRATGAASPPASSSASAPTPAYTALLWQLPRGLPLDRPETHTGPWDYPPSAKFDRLLRHARVPVGILTNLEHIRLVYAPHGESSGHITFRLDDMVTVGGRPILDAFVMLLSAHRFFGVAEERSLPAILAESRRRQANVTNELAAQVFDALAILLRGFEAAAERDGRALLDDALARALSPDAPPAERDHLYRGLLTVMLRLVFVLYAEDRGLLPVDHPLYAEHLSVLALFDRLQQDHGAHPDSMSRRYGAWGRLLALFRAVYLGVDHDTLHMPARHGTLFEPHTYPFLEGWGPAGSAPIHQPVEQADVRVPTLDDETVYRVLEKLVLFAGQRLSYRALDVEQIGSVYEALMGYHVVRVLAPAVSMRPERVWLTAEEVLEVAPGRRAKWLKEDIGLSKSQAEALAAAVKDLTAPGGAPDVLEALRDYAAGSTAAARALSIARAGQLVLQPGSERRRTSSHYTPRSLSAPIVARTLEPLLACMTDDSPAIASDPSGMRAQATTAPVAPPSHRILELKVCDPAMGSGAFLVEACRYLGDHLVAAWTREGKLEQISRDAPNEDPVLHARRLVAQRCLYGVDKNDAAVELAKLSLWLVTLARDMPFTFVDHALRHGDSLVGLSFDQIRAFHWKPGKQLETCERALREALDEAIAIRQRILDLAADGSPPAQREKERLLDDAQDALERVRLIADVCVGAFFAADKDKAREQERVRRLVIVDRWLGGDDDAKLDLDQLRAELRRTQVPFHWMLEFPEIFYADRPDPLDDDKVNHTAFIDAFVGNPPFAGGLTISGVHGNEYVAWGKAVLGLSSAKADLSAYFLLRTASLTGSHGTIGLITTNTIAQGDTREAGLAALVRQGLGIYDARSSLPWPGSAAVSVSVVHLATGGPWTCAQSRTCLDSKLVDGITSYLRAGKERGGPGALAANANISFQGVIVQGDGFVLSPQERDALVEANPRNQARIFPYIGGEEVNTRSDQSYERFVINFGEMPLETALGWPDLISIVEQRVKPQRMGLRDDQATARIAKQKWWLFWAPRTDRFAALAEVDRCLVTAAVTKHLCFSFQPTDRIFSNKVFVFPLDHFSAFASLQSRIHECWTRLLSSTLGETINYSASDCFETFPFPESDPRAVIPALESIGEQLYNARTKYMLDTNQGLTKTYNALKDPACTDPRILTLRHLHEQMDQAVLTAYAWPDLQVPPYCPLTDTDRTALQAFEDEIIDHLFQLNAQRAEQERAKGLGTAKKATAKSTKKRGRNAGRDDAQPSLDLDPE